MTIKRISTGLIFFVLLLLALLAYNWLRQPKQVLNIDPVASVFGNNSEIAQTLSRLIQFETVSHQDLQKNDRNEFLDLVEYLRIRFPLVYNTLNVETINDQALLYTWRGSNTNLKPVLITAHFDVVPRESDNWEKEAFSGHIDDEYIWGRGALDDKSAVVAILHAVSVLIENDFQPERTLLIAFGGDEEVGGNLGAAKISALLKERNIDLEFLLDEGMPITDGIMKGVAQPVAMIGVAEKGFMNVALTATTSGGHTSTPPAQTAVGILANAIAKLEASPMPTKISKPIELLFATLAGNMQIPQGIVVSNLWLTEPLVSSQLSKQNSTNALVRTTMATTMIQGSQQVNVLPKTATATINVRLLPGDSKDDVLNHIKQVIDNRNISATITGDSIEASRVSDIDTLGYKAIQTSLKQVFPDILIAPSLLIAGTDTKHYQSLTKNVYRFRPLWIQSDDIARFHGNNERIGISNLQQMTMFYYQLILNIN